MRAAACVFGLLALVALPAHAEIIGKATVIDGNTLEIAGQRIRLHRIAAPEPDQTCRWPNKVIPCGRIAGTAAMDLIAGVDRVVCATRGREPSGGWIATCTADGFDIGRNMVHTGRGPADQSHSTVYVDVENQARKAKRGLWKGEFVPPWTWRERGK